MENYQMFFPCSSSSMALSAYPSVSSSNMESSHHQAFSGGGSGSGGTNLGLRTHENHHVLMRNDHHQDHDQAMMMMMMINKAGDHRNISPNQHIINQDHDHHDEQGRSSISSSAAAGHGHNGKNKKGEKKIRKPKYAFQTRSQVDILDDGYRWRKYGQKAVKNNKFPRSYYRCTHQGCNVKKQVQRLTKDEGVVVTTYEGMHTHPIEKHTDNFEHILNQMQIYTPF
ncbi:WRKY domain containing protein [Trema orientale]|uniref:WRKY domain containing protein n=1 Tax=Trema orientale TaxID=63057 RepID=A0A2P5FC72_TREOI|nr:WRKY domain containing protein [Trema orientale]